MSTNVSVPGNQTETTDLRPVLHDNGSFSLLLDEGKFGQLQRVARMYAESSLVPAHFQKNIPNCAIGIQMALRLNVDPLMFLQHCYIVHGKPGIESKLAIALLNSSGRIKGSIKYRFHGEGDDYGCSAFVVTKDDERIEGPPVTRRLVKSEGWDKPKGGQPSKWQTMPQIMFCYRAAMFLVRAHFPEALMGMMTVEELEDINTITVSDSKPADIQPVRRLADLTDVLEQQDAKAEDVPVDQDESLDDQPEVVDIVAEIVGKLSQATTVEELNQLYSSMVAGYEEQLDADQREELKYEFEQVVHQLTKKRKAPKQQELV